MIKNNLLLLLLLTIIKIGSAQDFDLSFDGLIYVSQTEYYTYKLSLNKKDTSLSGISITDIGGPNQTTSEITGSLKNKKIKIKEVQILDTQSESPIDEFCFISFAGTIKNGIKGKMLSCNFTGKYMNDNTCAEGRIMVAETKLVQKLEEIVHNQIKKTLEKEIKDINYLTPEDTLNIGWDSDTIEMLIWDANVSDGDKIDLAINNQILLKNHEVYAKLYPLKYKLRKGKNSIKITAVNDGRQPPNTVRFELIDKHKRHPIITQLQTGKSLEIIVNN